MKVQFLLPLTIFVSVALVGLMKIRQKEQDREGRRGKFLDIKLRVTYDVLGEYQNEKFESENQLTKAQSQLKALEEELNLLQVKADKAKADADICKGGQKTINDELALQETTLNNLKAELEKEKMSWTKELETLKQQLTSRSAVCAFLKAGSDAASKLCSNDVVVEAPKEGEAKAEAPKQEGEAKAEAPKQEGEAKADASKQEGEEKADASKQEGEAKAEAPKQEGEAKVEAPKQEGEAKAEAPKKEEAKDAPAKEEAKAEAPKKT